MSLRHVASQVLELLDRGRYVTAAGPVDFAAAQRAAVAGTRLYTPADVARLVDGTAAGPAPRVEVSAELTQAAARRLCDEGEDLVLLNFASARNPGGGFLRGAKAQEEDLCRCSGLYPALLTQRAYYEANRAQPSLLYTDHAIYSPRVPFFRVRGTDELLDAPFLASVITAPAPNAGPLLESQPDAGPAIAETFARRWASVLAIAAAHGHRCVLLGAWGCGAFHNDPHVAATTAAAALADRGAAFSRVVFAIPSKGAKSARNLAVFREVLGAARA